MSVNGRGNYRLRGRGELVTGSPAITTIFCRPSTSLSEGVVTNAKVEQYRGPAFGEDNTATGAEFRVHYSAGDFNRDDLCVANKIQGKWYVTCFKAGFFPS